MPKKLKTLSLCMIVRDEEETLPLVLSDAKEFADEIIVVDTGSVDRSREIAKDFTDRVYDFKWIDDFSAARNFSLSKAAGDYVLWLDADDRVPPKSRALLNELKGNFEDADVIMLPYETAFDKNGATFRFYRERIFKNNAGFRFVDPVHEVVVPRGKILYREIPVEHRKKKSCVSDRNLNIYRALLLQGGTLNARQKYYFANELLRNGFESEAVAAYVDFLNAEGGMAENRASARLALARLKRDNPKEAAEILLKGIYEAPPDAETLVELGHIMVREERFAEAIPFYLAAANSPPSPRAFRNLDMETYIPFLQLALCYYRLNDKRNALFYNGRALSVKPDGELALRNQPFYEAMSDSLQ